jgi:Homeodomain-like domain
MGELLRCGLATRPGRFAGLRSVRRMPRRLLAIAAVLDGASRRDAAKIGGMDRQTLRDWGRARPARPLDGGFCALCQNCFVQPGLTRFATSSTTREACDPARF